jgi:hypothetical protein
MITACGADFASASAASLTLLPSPLRKTAAVACSFGVVEHRDGDLRHADGGEVLHQRLRLAARGGAHEETGALELVARRVGHRIAGHPGRAGLLQQRRGGRRGGRADAAEEAEHALGAEQLLVVGDRALGLELVV